MSDERASDNGDSGSAGKQSSPTRKSSSVNSARPRKSSPKDAVSLSELDFIERIRQEAPKRLGAHKTHSALSTQHSALLTGIGDDAAVIRTGDRFDTVITADLLVEGVDFRLSTTTPRMLGHKALAVSLSDIAAMGARPRYALLSIGAPPAVWRAGFLDEFYEGFFALADAHGVSLIGGDVSSTRARAGVVIDSIVIGEVAGGRAVLRSGARPGDLLFVTGALGGAAAGLLLLEQRKPARGSSGQARSKPSARRRGRLSEADESLILRQLRPDARAGWGQLLSERKLATAMIDLSDGLSSDLAHLCRESGVGARIDASKIPVDASIARSSLKLKAPALDFALNGGEDFELLFTVGPRAASKLPEELDGIPATQIGEVLEGKGTIRLTASGREQVLKPSGFRHF